jgi:hypothetical protein
MSVRALDSSGDWTFGQSLANYLTGADEVRQNVITRLKSFKNDWFLDTTQNIDWFNILGNKNTQKIIIQEITRVTQETDGVRQVNNVTILSINLKRELTVSLSFDTIYDQSFIQQIGIPIP